MLKFSIFIKACFVIIHTPPYFKRNSSRFVQNFISAVRTHVFSLMNVNSSVELFYNTTKKEHFSIRFYSHICNLHRQFTQNNLLMFQLYFILHQDKTELNSYLEKTLFKTESKKWLSINSIKGLRLIVKNKLQKRAIKLSKSKTKISYEEITIQLIFLDYSEKFLEKQSK